MKKILPVFSYAFHPVFIPLLALLCYFMTGNSMLYASTRWLLMLQVIIMTILIPIMTFFLLKALGRVDSIMLKDIGQRRLPLVIQAILFFTLIRSIPVYRAPELYFFFLGAFVTTVASLISLFVRLKSSLHMAGMGGLLFFVIGLSLHNAVNLVYTIAFLFVMSGFVAASRIEMKAHDNREILAGFIAGALPQIALWPLWL